MYNYREDFFIYVQGIICILLIYLFIMGRSIVS